jgi:hypothetical protein
MLPVDRFLKSCDCFISRDENPLPVAMLKEGRRKMIHQERNCQAYRFEVKDRILGSYFILIRHRGMPHTINFSAMAALLNLQEHLLNDVPFSSSSLSCYYVSLIVNN